MRRTLLQCSVGAALLVASVGCREITDPPDPIAAPVLPGLISVTGPATALADGATLVRLVATVDTSLKGDARVVKFATTAGLFSDKTETTVRADAAGTAIAVIRAPADTVTAIITATAGPTSQRWEVAFTPARAEWIDVDPSSLVIEGVAGKEIDITATLRRSFGTPNAGATVTFSAKDANGGTLGDFTSVPRSSASGAAKTRYFAGTTDYRGLVTITATTKGVGDVDVSDTTTIRVVAPK